MDIRIIAIIFAAIRDCWLQISYIEPILVPSSPDNDMPIFDQLACTILHHTRMSVDKKTYGRHHLQSCPIPANRLFTGLEHLDVEV